MYSDYNDFYEYMDPSVDGMGVAAVVLGIWLIVMLLMLAYSVVTYVLNSLGMYTIAKRRGIHHPWLCWIPVCSMWILGSISDQYQYVAKGKIRSRRKVLLGLYIALYAAMLLYYIWYFMSLFGLVATGDLETANISQVMSMVIPIVIIAMAMMAVAIVTAVFLYIAYYDLFVSCNPNNAVVFLVLGIIFSFLLPFFVFASRKKDLGMPPRKSSVPTPPQPTWQPPVLEEQPAETEPEVAAEEPAEQPGEPAEEPEE